MTEQTTPQRPGTSRRDFLRRGAIVGGTLVWAAPAVQTLAKPAFASHGTCVTVRVYEYVRGTGGSTWTRQANTTSDFPTCVPVGGHWTANQVAAADSDVELTTSNTSVTVDVLASGCVFLADTDLVGVSNATGNPCITGTKSDGSQATVSVSNSTLNRVRFQLCCSS